MIVCPYIKDALARRQLDRLEQRQPAVYSDKSSTITRTCNGNGGNPRYDELKILDIRSKQV